MIILFYCKATKLLKKVDNKIQKINRLELLNLISIIKNFIFNEKVKLKQILIQSVKKVQSNLC